jgi:hypothetical protein
LEQFNICAANIGFYYNLALSITPTMQFTQYFHSIRLRPDRSGIELAWIEQVITQPIKEVVQTDGRIRRWAAIPEAKGRYLRVVLLEDGKTVHNAFFDRSFTP